MQDERDSAGEPPEHTVIAYHERTKHHFHRYAASLGFMDWATQPDPFRRFAGADLFQLPMPERGAPLPYDRVFSGNVPAVSLDVAAVSRFLRYSLSITAWKAVGTNRWALRANPSSGNLHPTEGYVVLPALDGLDSSTAVYHYAAKAHALECRARLDTSTADALLGALPPGSFLVGLSSIHWREAWKYGERAFRYCQHDVGHALAGLRLAAAALGWQLTLLAHLSSDRVASVLGLDRHGDFGDAEREEPELLAVVTTRPGAPAFDAWTPPRLNDGVRWAGRANLLSQSHRADWPVIDAVAPATTRVDARALRESRDGLATVQSRQAQGELLRAATFEHVVLTRRSAVSMDGVTRMPAETLLRTLTRLMPDAEGLAIPWDSVPWRPRIHLLLFVQRVDGLQPGLYMLVRDAARQDALRQAMRDDCLWTPAPGADASLPLSLLLEGDCRSLAAQLSCGQAIASDGAFSVGMLADFTDSLAHHGAPFYRNLFWECGTIGQMLYLEAEAAGLRGTGIGCFFDDPVRDLCGFTSSDWQSLYHFTVGGAVEDTRLTTLPAYDTEAPSS
ncbi:MAG: SagB/ThcOx family dehydrogenase [Vicinamibacterales bacterium]